MNRLAAQAEYRSIFTRSIGLRPSHSVLRAGERRQSWRTGGLAVCIADRSSAVFSKRSIL